MAAGVAVWDVDLSVNPPRGTANRALCQLLNLPMDAKQITWIDIQNAIIAEDTEMRRNAWAQLAKPSCLGYDPTTLSYCVRIPINPKPSSSEPPSFRFV